MHDILYEKQSKLGSFHILSYVRSLALDAEQFIENHYYTEKLSHDESAFLWQVIIEIKMVMYGCA